MPNPITIPLNTTIPLDIKAEEPYSSQQIAVFKGETYIFSCDSRQRWTDWKIKTTPNGFFNPFAWLLGLRVKKAKCFCLCACYGNNDNTGFAIGNYRKVDIEQDGVLSFFANDTNGYYQNNHGAITLNVRRTT